MYYYSVALCNKNFDEPLVYCFEKFLEIFEIVEVPLNNSFCFGVVVAKNLENNFNFVVKEIKQTLNIFFSEKNFEFLSLIAKVYLWNLGVALELFVPKYLKKSSYHLLLEKEGKCVHLLNLNLKKTKELKSLKLFEKKFVQQKLWNFTNEQNEIVNQILKLKTIGFLQGFTGSGKTVVALEAVAQMMQKNCKILIIVPHIALNQYWASLIEKRLGMPAFLFHNGLSEIYKNSVYKWAKSAENGVLIGTRSAIFLPFVNLQFIVVDEEHSLTLNQDHFPIYGLKNLLHLMFKTMKIPILFISATPSLESYKNILEKKYQHFLLSNSYNQKQQTKLTFVKKGNFILANKTAAVVQEVLNRKNQVLIFVNKKGFAPYCLCNKCKEYIMCINCNKFMNIYKNYKLMCHYCYYSEFLSKVCKKCEKETTWSFFGVGIEKVEDYLLKMFGKYKIQSVTSDVENLNEILQKIDANEIDIILTTQVLAQGHDFKNVGLVVILDAETGISSVDFRISEHIYQLWLQIKGRSGRHGVESHMIVQYNSVDNKFVELFKRSDAYDALLKEREKNNLPPFSKMHCVYLSSKDKGALENAVEMFLEEMKNYSICTCIGPLDMGKLNNVFQMQFLIKTPNGAFLHEIINKKKFVFKKTEFSVEINI